MGGANSNLYGSDLSLLGPWATKLAQRDKLKWIIALTASLGAILEIIDVNIVNVALPDIQGNVGATLSEVGWVSTAYSCANVIIIPLTAWLGVRFGKKRYFVFSLAGFTMASILCGLSSNLSMLIMARVLQGLCGGGLLAKAQSMLYETFPRAEQGAAQALFGIGVISGAGSGRLLDRYARLAVDIFHQPASRHPGNPDGVHVLAGGSQGRHEARCASGLAGHWASCGGAGLFADHAGGGTAIRLVRLPVHHDDGCWKRGRAGLLYLVGTDY